MALVCIATPEGTVCHLSHDVWPCGISLMALLKKKTASLQPPSGKNWAHSVSGLRHGMEQESEPDISAEER